MSIEKFNHTVDTWIKQLDRYDLAELCIKPSPTNWSLGQLYFHLIKNTAYFIEQIKICQATQDHANEETSPNAIAMFSNNEFPDLIIEGPDTNVDIPQPGSKKELKDALLQLKNKMGQAVFLIPGSGYHGKTKHPGLGYFSGGDWLQFAEMHFRHHLRQKKRIDGFFS